VYSVPAAGSLNAQLARRQSVVIGWKLERRSNSVMADTSHFARWVTYAGKCAFAAADIFFLAKAITYSKYSGIGATEGHSRLASANQPAEIHAITRRMTA